jgi:hypothetical protein
MLSGLWRCDDAICGDMADFHGLMAKIGETLAVESHEVSNFQYKGLRVPTVFKEEQSVFEINVDGDDYLTICRTMDVPLGEDTEFVAAAVNDRLSFGLRSSLAMRRPSSARTWRVFCRPDQFRSSSYVDDYSCLISE